MKKQIKGNPVPSIGEKNLQNGVETDKEFPIYLEIKTYKELERVLEAFYSSLNYNRLNEELSGYFERLYERASELEETLPR